MKKMMGILCLLVLVCTLCACEGEKEASPLVNTTVYAYNVFMDNTPQKVKITVNGELPPEDQQTGDFSGNIVVKEADGTRHSYKDLQYRWTEDILLIYRGDPTAEKGDGVVCWLDPQEPESVFLADRNWRERDPVLEITAYISNELTDAEKRALGTQLNRIEGVEEALFVSAEEALSEFNEAHENDEVFAGVEAGNLRARYCVTVKTEAAEMMAQQIAEISGVEEVMLILWAPESICILAPEDDNEKTEALFWHLPKLPE